MEKRSLNDATATLPPAKAHQAERPQIARVDGKWVVPAISKQQVHEAKRCLKQRGVDEFLEQYLPESPKGSDMLYITALLGFSPSMMSEDVDDDKNLIKVVRTLQRAINRVITTRMRIMSLHTVDQAVDAIAKAQRIIVLTGAGISTSLGIPDFRSSQGIYSLVQDLGLDDPQQVFDMETFSEDPDIFYKVAHMVLPPEDRWTPTHAFVKALSDKGKLLRNYTQNIDNLEAQVGIPKDKYIQCHGSFATATCFTCKRQVEGSKIFPIIRTMQLPVCPRCHSRRRRLLKDSNTVGALGIMKPDITFFGEDLPRVFYDNIDSDVTECDLLICIGTSLKVSPVNGIVNRVSADIPQILINRDDIKHAEFDVSFLGYCDDVVTYLSNRLDWSLDHKDFTKMSQDKFIFDEAESAVGLYRLEKKEEASKPIVNGLSQ